MRYTIQSDAIRSALHHLQHATNGELHRELSQTMPRLSVQSIHRITARLVEQGEIRLGPSDGHTVVLDARRDVHDHFVCTSCGGILDVEIPEDAIAAIQEQLGKNLVRDGITIRGCCENCAATT